MTLENKRIVVTRAPHQAGELVALLRERGAEPLLYPCIDIAPPDDAIALTEALRQINTFDWLILTSENTVQAVSRYGVKAWPAVAAIGTTTAQAVRDWLKVEPRFVANQQTGEALARMLPLTAGAKILLPQSEIAMPTTAKILRERGAGVTAVTAYQTTIGSGGVDLPALLQAGEVDAITLASGSAAQNLVTRLGGVDGLEDVPTVCMGASTAAVAQECGLKNLLVPAKSSLVDMVALLANNLE